MERESAKEKGNNLYAHPVTLKFLSAAIAEGAHIKIQKSFNVDRRDRSKEDLWVRMRNVAGIYYSCDITTKELAVYYNVNHQKISEIVRKFVKHIWENCSDGLKYRFPLDELQKVKPRTKRIQDKITRNSFSGNLRRQLVIVQGNPIPQQELLDQVTVDFYMRNRYLFTTVTRCCEDAGWIKKPHGKTMREALSILRRAGIPCRRISAEDDSTDVGKSFNFVCVTDKESAVSAVQSKNR